MIDFKRIYYNQQLVIVTLEIHHNNQCFVYLLLMTSTEYDTINTADNESESEWYWTHFTSLTEVDFNSIYFNERIIMDTEGMNDCNDRCFQLVAMTRRKCVSIDNW